MCGRFALALAMLGACSLEEQGGLSSSDAGKDVSGSGGGKLDASGFGGSKDAAIEAKAGTGGVSPSDAASDAETPTGGVAGAGGKDASVVDCNNYPGSSPFTVNGETHCYWRSSVAGKFVDAVANCSAPGAYLVSIHSAEENEFVRGFAGVDTLWIGATDNKNGDDPSCSAPAFHWVSGEALAYVNWTDNNPDCVCGNCDGNCDCQHRGSMLADGGWRDRWEGDLYFWVCEVGALVP